MNHEEEEQKGDCLVEIKRYWEVQKSVKLKGEKVPWGSKLAEGCQCLTF